MQKALGIENEKLIAKATKAIESGDAKQVGSLMVEAQNMFDSMVVRLLPKELAAPQLHKVP